MLSAFLLVNKRYQSRIDYGQLARLQRHEEELNKEYTRLQLEEGTYSSRLVLQSFALNQLNLIEPDKNHIMEVSTNVSQ
jgi:cell division protein FtsL